MIVSADKEQTRQKTKPNVTNSEKSFFIKTNLFTVPVFSGTEIIDKDL